MKYLNVYGRRYETELGDYYNCGKCPKCVLTMTLLDVDGSLERFKSAFDMSEFKKNKAKVLGKPWCGGEICFGSAVICKKERLSVPPKRVF